jgi:hypothetical protein
MPVQGLPTSSRALIRACMARIATVTGFDPNTIKFARMGSKIPFSGDRDIILRLTRPRPIEGLMEAAPELDMQCAVTRGLAVQIRTRTGFGLSDRDDAWLESDIKEPPDVGTELGHSYIEDLVLTAMIPFRPVDDLEVEEPNVLTIDDILLVDGSEYRDEYRQIPPDDPTWGSSILTFRLNYIVKSAPLPDPED